jgi:hypothetical protein
MAQVVGRNRRYLRNVVTVSKPRLDVAISKRPNSRSLTPKASGVTVYTCLLAKSPTGRTRQKVGRIIGYVSRRVTVNPLTPCRNIHGHVPMATHRHGGLTSDVLFS